MEPEPRSAVTLAQRLRLLDPDVSESEALRLLQQLRAAEVALLVRFELPRATLGGWRALAAHLDQMGVPDDRAG